MYMRTSGGKSETLVQIGDANKRRSKLHQGESQFSQAEQFGVLVELSAGPRTGWHHWASW